MAHLNDGNEAAVRGLMVDEFDQDLQSGVAYFSKYQTSYGHGVWPEMLNAALRSGDDDTLIAMLDDSALWLDQYEKRTPSGGTTWARVPVTASETLAQGEFQRYYLRAVCLVAIQQGVDVVVVRLKDVVRPRTGSEGLIGTRIDPVDLLDDLRQNIGIDTVLGIPAGPNSGLGVELGN